MAQLVQEKKAKAEPAASGRNGRTASLDARRRYGSAVIRTACADCEKEEKNTLVSTPSHRKLSSAGCSRCGDNADSQPPRTVTRSRDPVALLGELGEGRPLEGSARSRMESVFGRDFRSVRIHTDETADTLSRDLGAAAFTVGDHIAFRSGRFQPGTPMGDAVLAHELAHTIQQEGAAEASIGTHGVESLDRNKEAGTAARVALGTLWGAMAAGPGQTVALNAVMPRLRSGLGLLVSICDDAPSGGAGAASSCAVSGRFTSIPSGNVVPTRRGNDFNAPFDMKAEFTAGSGSGCTCAPGEYRQEIKGTFKLNGSVVRFPLCTNTLNPTTYQEDCDDRSGTTLRYGYRSIVFATSKFEPNQATGCRFVGQDAPGGQGLPSGTTLDLDLGFRGKLVDTGRSNAVLTTAEWTVKGSTTIP